jgi:acetyl esterase/lipase
MISINVGAYRWQSVFYPGETLPENSSLPVLVYIHGGG